MLAIKQKTKTFSLIKYIFKNNILNYLFLLSLSGLEMYYFHNYIIFIFFLILFPISFFRYKTYHKEEFFQFFEKFFVYKNPYKQDIIIYFEDIESVKMKYGFFLGKFICIEIKNKSILKYDNNKKIKIYDFLNYKEVITHLVKRIIK